MFSNIDLNNLTHESPPIHHLDLLGQDAWQKWSNKKYSQIGGLFDGDESHGKTVNI